ncbi:MAG: hypothetical protein QXS27_02295, partial [Candidatus Jordarchaeaceae archaeon]
MKNAEIRPEGGVFEPKNVQRTTDATWLKCRKKGKSISNFSSKFLSMRVRWLGNSCVEILGKRHFIIDPNFLVEPQVGVELVFVTHEHPDHFDIQKFKMLNAPLVAPYSVLSM